VLKILILAFGLLEIAQFCPDGIEKKRNAMQIILQEDVEKLGTRGEVVEVAAGYARNYLLPHKLALEASPANIKRLEKIRITLSKRTATEKDAAQQQAALLNQVTVKFARKAGETDQLFGSVTSADLADALKAQGFEIDKRRIQLDEPIKIIGERPVTVKLLHGVTAEFKVVVEKEA
jgi:large subunit ribosomal protein L9